VRKARKHALVRYFHVIEEEEAVVHGVVTEFRSNITDMDILERLVRLQIADLHDERMRAVCFAVNDELRHDAGVIRRAPERADPPLASREMRRMDGECLVLGVPGRRGFESTDVGTMAKLGLSIAADDLVRISRFSKLLLLFRSALTGNGDLGV